jgi:HAD superfamily hydrolase (TIGR01509 family)
MASHPPACVLLDAGHVLVELDFGNLATQLKKITGFEPDQVRAAFADDGLARAYELGLMSDDDFCLKVCTNLGVKIPRTAIVDAWNSIIGKPLMPEEILAALSAKSTLWVVSNTNRLHFNCIRKRYPYLKYFQGYVLSYETGVAKPDPEMFRLALAAARAKAEEALFIDDQRANVVAAQGLGIDAIQFFDLRRLNEELRFRRLL